ncbi:hypothetical protein GW17_00043237 [Ensete ventricosum]|nr:hypothetical protein GW17_00043237 [Ensete ventricosum]
MIILKYAVCDQVLISCGVPREQGLTSRAAIETPLAVNGFNDQALRISSDKQQLSQSNYGTDITVPTLQKQPLSTGTSAEGLDGNGMAGPSIAPKKRRKPWTKEEDMELIAGVQKFGEGNWANILKGDFKHNRTASQLSQGGALLHLPLLPLCSKLHNHIRPGGGARPSPINNVKTLAVTNSTGLQPTGVRISRPSVMGGPPAANPVSVSSGTKYGCQQVQGCSGRVGSNPLNTTSTNQQVIIESNSGEVSHEMTEQKGDIDISSIDVDELLAEEVKCVDEMELDGTMSRDDQMDLLSLDTNTNEDNDFNNTYGAQASMDKQMNPPDSVVAENIIMENNVVFSDVEAAESKALEVDDNDDQILLEKGTASFTGEQNKISPVGNLNAQDHQLIGEEVMADRDRESCTNGQQHALPEDTATGSKIPVDDDSISSNNKEVE